MLDGLLNLFASLVAKVIHSLALHAGQVGTLAMHLSVITINMYQVGWVHLVLHLLLFATVISNTTPFKNAVNRFLYHHHSCLKNS